MVLVERKFLASGPTGGSSALVRRFCARELGVRVDLLAPEDVRRLVPELSVADVAAGAHEPESGYADPSSTTNALVNRARELGATIVQYVAVEALLADGKRVTGVPTTQCTISAPAVVVR